MNYDYKVLNKQKFFQGRYSLVPIRMEDRYDILKWRNDQIYHLRQSKPLTRKDQDNYFNTVIKQLFATETPSQLLFSYLEDNKCIGYGGLVHINWIDKNAEVSFIMDTQIERNEFHKHWGIYIDLLRQIAFNDLGLHKIYTYAFDLRPHLYEAIEAKGFVKEAVLKEHCFFNNEYKDVVIHRLMNSHLVIRKIRKEDNELTYHWANDERTRANSFNSNPISFEEHSKWFESKLTDKNSWYYICELNHEPTGLIRFDKKDDKLIIGITIDEKYRGKKLSSVFLKQGCETISTEMDLPIIAYIKKNNIPSIKSFEKAGFTYQSDLKINDIDSYEYAYRK